LIDAPAIANSGPRPRGRGFLETISIFAHPRRAPVLAAALAAVIYLLAGWQLSAFLPAGRERGRVVRFLASVCGLGWMIFRKPRVWAAEAASASVSASASPRLERARLDVESWHREVTLAAGGEALVEVPASRRGATPLRVFAAEGFRPSALDPANGDHCRLGVWIEVR
jgi:hypothetical protein